MPSSSFSRLRNTVYHGVKTKIARQGFQDTVNVISQQARLTCDNYKLISSLQLSTLSDLNIFLRPGTILAGTAASIANSKRRFSVVSAFSRTISTPSVSGPSYQICGYHIDCFISESTRLPSGGAKKKFPMGSVTFSKGAIGDCIVRKLVSEFSCDSKFKNNVSALYCKKGVDSCTLASMSLKNRDQLDRSSIYGYYLYKAIRSSFGLNLNSWSDSKEYHSASAASTLTAITAPDGSFDSSLLDCYQANVTMSPEGNIPLDKALKLLSGSCCLPHPDKEDTGGEDAHFICPVEQAVGVADGVGGWAEHGVDAGEYARELMSNAVSAIREEPRGSIDLARVLEKAHSITKAKGSSTACIIALTDQGLHAINLGDSGFIVIREGCTVFRSPVQQHDFNFTFQLESGDGGDLPSCGQVFSVPVAPGDVIIAGTDGLFDNLYSNEVTGVVVHALRAGLAPQVTAQKIAALARQRAQDRDRQTPFSTAAQDAGFRYYGGKLDDITVVVSYITSCNKEGNTSLSANGST
ncbi:putative protein phosphatase 2C 55 [Silene latifolia]|uniref:putative protein phosphatase 2C 55 n=1 Tax=Silene latifolia TaxID=37657 RepID=UPI003D777FEE